MGAHGDVLGTEMVSTPSQLWSVHERRTSSRALCIVEPQPTTSQFSGHAVIPSLYRDMKSANILALQLRSLTFLFIDPEHFNSVINVAYIIACSTSLVMGVIGYVMCVSALPNALHKSNPSWCCRFGKDVTDEVTQDMLFIEGYPAEIGRAHV